MREKTLANVQFATQGRQNLFVRGSLFIILTVGLLSASGGAYAQSLVDRWVVERVEGWDALFDRTSGWTGADGIYSIPLSGVDSPGSAIIGKTLFVFSDTFIGEVGASGQRLAGTKLVNNTVAFLSGGMPIPDNIVFLWGEDEKGDPAAMFVPGTPDSSPGDWYWLCDGISLDGMVYLFALRMREGGGGVINFAVDGVSLIEFPLDSTDPSADYTQVDTPLYHVLPGSKNEIIFGAAILANTAEAEAPMPDGYIYIYGYQTDSANKRLVAARVLPEHFEDFSMWRYWNGIEWSPNIEEAAPLAGRVSSEFSVSPLPDGRFVLVFQLDTLSQYVAVRIGESPVGPFGPIRRIWRCPEPDLDPDIYTYNAKAHPGLSGPDELLISYNVNTFDAWDDLRYSDIYRPRFIRIRLRR